MSAMADDNSKQARMARLVWAGILEALCIVAGVIAWYLTGSWTWIVIGIVASLGFSLPAIIRFIRERQEERD